jgi:hypothetical protein
MSEINTGIIIGNKPVCTGDTLLFENIGNDAIVNTLAEKLDKGSLDAIVIHFYKYTDGLNLWSIMLIPVKNNKPLSKGEYFETLEEDWEDRHNEPRVEIHDEPRVSFINDLLRNSKNISFTNNFDIYLKNKEIKQFNSWKF